MLSWEKYYFGNHDASPANEIINVPWVGVSRSALKHVHKTYSNFIAIYIKMTSNNILMMLNAATGA